MQKADTIVKPHNKSYFRKKTGPNFSRNKVFLGDGYAEQFTMRKIPNESSNIDTNFVSKKEVNDMYKFSEGHKETVYDKQAKAHFREQDKREYENSRWANIGFVPVFDEFRYIPKKQQIMEENANKLTISTGNLSPSSPSSASSHTINLSSLLSPSTPPPTSSFYSPLSSPTDSAIGSSTQIPASTPPVPQVVSGPVAGAKYIINPKTGRKVIVGGPSYKALVKNRHISPLP